MGLPPDLVAEIAAFEPPGFEVWPRNMPIVDAFLAVASQWRTVPIGDGQSHWLGLDYAAVRAGYELAEIRIPPRIWSGVQTMERAAAAALNGYGG